MASPDILNISDSDASPRRRSSLSKRGKKQSVKLATTRKERTHTVPNQKAQKQSNSTNPTVFNAAPWTVGDNSSKKRHRSTDKRIDVDAEFIDLTTSKENKILPILSVPLKPPTKASQASPNIELPTNDNIATVTRQQCDSKLDLDKAPEHDLGNKREAPAIETPRQRKARTVTSKRPSTSQERPDQNLPYIDLVDSDLDESIRSSPSWRKSGRSSKATTPNEPNSGPPSSSVTVDPSTLANDPGLQKTESGFKYGDGASDPKGDGSQPWFSLQLPAFRQMWEAQQAERRGIEESVVKTATSILKNGSSSDNGMPNNRKRAHFAEDPVDAEVSAPETKKQKKSKKKLPMPETQPESNNDRDHMSAFEKPTPIACVPTIKVSTSETYPGPPSGMTSQLRRSTPTRAAPEPVVPIPERSRTLSKSSRWQSSNGIIKPSVPIALEAQTDPVANEKLAKSSKLRPKAQGSPKNTVSKALLNKSNTSTAPILIDDDSEFFPSKSNAIAKIAPDNERGRMTRQKTVPIKREAPDEETIKTTGSLAMLTSLSPKISVLEGSQEKVQPSTQNIRSFEKQTSRRTKRIKSADSKAVQCSPMKKMAALTPPPSCEALSLGSLREKGGTILPNGTYEKERKTLEESLEENINPLSKRTRVSTTPSSSHFHDLSPLERVDNKKLKEREKRRKAKSQQRAKEHSKRKTPDQVNGGLEDEEKDGSIHPPKGTKPKEKTPELTGETTAEEITAIATSHTPATISKSGSTPTLPCIPPFWSQKELDQLSHDALVFSAYLQEVRELTPRMSQSLSKIPEQEVGKMFSDISIDLKYMKKLVSYAASEAQQKVRVKASRDFERLGEWVIEKRREAGGRQTRAG